MKSWKPVVKVFGEDKWHHNGLSFATEAEAQAAANDLMGRWSLVEQASAHPSEEPVTHVWDGSKAQYIASMTNILS